MTKKDAMFHPDSFDTISAEQKNTSCPYLFQRCCAKHDEGGSVKAVL